MIKDFIKEWFPKTKEWDNIAKFIIESGVEITEDKNPKWLTGYTNIGKSHKPQHKNDYKRYMEESMFMLHDVIHQIFTLNVDENITKEEYVNRQIYGELFTFYLTEYVIPKTWKNYSYRGERGCYDLMGCLMYNKSYFHNSDNIIDFMWDIFIEGNITPALQMTLKSRKCKESFKKYSKMFKEDLKNSRKNYKLLPKNITNYCIVGESSQNHTDFFEAVSKGAIKNIKREFNLTLPDNWI